MAEGQWGYCPPELAGEMCWPQFLLGQRGMGKAFLHPDDPQIKWHLNQERAPRALCARRPPGSSQPCHAFNHSSENGDCKQATRTPVTPLAPAKLGFYKRSRRDPQGLETRMQAKHPAR